MTENTTKIYCTFQDAPDHNYQGHPERPQRLQPLRAWLDQPPYPEVQWLDFAPARENEAALVHNQALLAFLQSACQQGSHEFEPSPSYVTPASYQAALGAVGATLAVSRKILSMGKGHGFAIVRPPGHHAEPDASMGFCLLNNIAIAAADAVASGVGKAAIVDFDAHHGNGTQAAFWNTAEVGYLSTHEDYIYPGSGRISEASHARGRIINIPLPSFCGNLAFTAIFEQVVLPWLRAYQPGMIFVSAGFDAHFSDPLTTLTLDTAGYYQLSKMLADMADELCDGRIMFVLEGGYDPRALKDNIQACLAALGGHEQFEDSYGKAPDQHRDVNALIQDLRKRHSLQED